MDVRSDLISLRTTDVVVIAAVVVAAVVVASAVAAGVVSAVAVVVDSVEAVVAAVVVVAEVEFLLASCKPIKDPLENTRAPRLPSEVIETLYLWLNILVSEARMGVA